MLKRIARRASVLCLAAAPCLATAQPGGGDESRWRIGAAFGYGERSNPLVQSEDLPVVVDLDIAWFGDRWFFDNGDGGITFADNPALTASLIGRVNSDRVFFGRTNTRLIAFETVTAGPDAPLQLDPPVDFKPPDRDYAIEIGFEVLTDGRWGALQFQAFQDVSDTHDGFELYADYSFGWRRQRFFVEPSIGASFKSARLNDYYWGLTAAEGRQVIPAYEAGSGINWRTRLVIGYQLSSQWGISLVAEREILNDEAAASPIVEESAVEAVFAGLSWRF